MSKPRIAIISFPGTNGDTENLRTFWRCGFDAFVFRWNDSKEKLKDVDGYFIGAGFAYEDRGRAGMVAGRDPIFQHLHEEAAKGKAVIGSCNGAQVLVESELIPMGDGLKMSLARNVMEANGSKKARGFVNHWVWMTPGCGKDRCATSNWVDSTGSPQAGVMQIPIAHGEGRFTTKDKDVIEELKNNDQLAFKYCDQDGKPTDVFPLCPNGSLFGAAGICNKEGNVVAIMPHPERTLDGDPYFLSLKNWIERHTISDQSASRSNESKSVDVSIRDKRSVEIFIDTIIVNNEERTVEQAAKKLLPKITLKQLRYLSPGKKKAEEVLSHIAQFNPNKESAYIREGDRFYKWDSDKKRKEEVDSPLTGISLLRRDDPDTGAGSLGVGSQTGVCYMCKNVEEGEVLTDRVLQIFGNPHASSIERLAE